MPRPSTTAQPPRTAPSPLDLPSETPLPVRVWFEGLTQPMSARAIKGADGLRLVLDLPHLRERSEVFVCFDGLPGLSLTTSLDQVSFCHGEVPSLTATVQVQPEQVRTPAVLPEEDAGPLVIEEGPDGEDLADELRAHLRPDELKLMAAADTARMSLSGVRALQLAREQASSPVTPLPGQDPASPPAPAPDLTLPDLSAPDLTLRDLPALDLGCGERRAEINLQLLNRAELNLDDSFNSALLHIPSEAPYSITKATADSHSMWQLNPLEVGAGAECALPAPRGVSLPRMKSLGLVLGLVLAGAGAMLSFSHAGKLNSLGARLSSWIRGPQEPGLPGAHTRQGAAPEHRPRPSSGMQLPAGALSAPAALPGTAGPDPASAAVQPPLARRAGPRTLAPVQVLARQAATAGSPAALAPLPPGLARLDRPRLLNEGGRPTLIVPFSGSAEGAASYVLDDPDALVINLPRARPRGGFKDEVLIRGGLRKLWVRERDGGLHLRVFFRGPRPQHRLQIAEDHLRLTFLP